MPDWTKDLLNFAAKTFIVVFAVYLGMHLVILSHLTRLERATAVIEARAAAVDQQTRMILSMFAPNNPQTLAYLSAQDEQRGDIKAAAEKMAAAVQFMEVNYPAFKAKLDQLNKQVKK